MSENILTNTYLIILSIKRLQYVLNKYSLEDLTIAIEYLQTNKSEILCSGITTVFDELDLVRFCKRCSKTEYIFCGVIIYDFQR